MFFSYKNSLEKTLIAKITNKSLITISTSKYSMPNYLHLTLQSERLQLIPVSLKYAEDLCKEFDSEITEYLWPSAPKTQEEISKHITEQQSKMQAGKEIALVIVNKANQDFLGYAGLHQANSKTPELGIWLKKTAHGFHYGFEAMNLLKTWAETNLNYDYLKYPVVRQNIPSRKIAEKMGGIIEDEYIKTSEAGKLLDEVEYRFYGVKMTNKKSDEKININESLVRNLVAKQLPQWSHLPINAVKNGAWDNRTFHLGTEMLIRMPSSAEYAGQAEKEQAWLPKLASQLPLPIPAPIALGKPDDTYPWKWSINRWLPGETALVAPINDLCEFAEDLALFLKALQRIDTTGGPLAGPHSFYRGGDLAVYDSETRKAIEVLKDEIDFIVATDVWETALSTPWKNPSVWVHGDVSVGNLLVSQGKLSAVIDFGQLAIGDPACDLTIAWTLFEGKSREVFYQTLQLDPGTWARGRAWALWKAMMYLVNQQSEMNFEAKRALRTIHEVIKDHRQLS